jgi:hypothetical protein
MKTVYLIHAYRGSKYVCLLVPWAFESQEAAQWYIDTWNYTSLKLVIETVPVFDLEQVKNLASRNK